MGKATQSHPTCDGSGQPSATTVHGTTTTGGHSAPDGVCESADLLGTAGRELEARGLRVRYLDSEEHLTDIEVSDPSCAESGRVSGGNDGYLIWERWGPKMGTPSEAIVDIVETVLIGKDDLRAPVHEAMVR